MKILVLLGLLIAGISACATTKKDVKIPSEMQPNKGMTESRAKGMGAGSIFTK